MKTKIFIVHLKHSIEHSVFEYLLQFVQSEKRERIIRQRIKQNADNMLIGEILAKATIKKSFGINISNQKFAYSEFGKPYLTGFPNIHFNISHSGEYIACALSDKPVGIDIQKIGEYSPIVAKKVCSESELKQIESSRDKASEFTKLWTQKEAVLKMHGIGIANSDIKNCLDNITLQSVAIEGYWLSVCEK